MGVRMVEDEGRASTSSDEDGGTGQVPLARRSSDKNGGTVSHSMSYSYPYHLKPQKNDIPLVFQGRFPYFGTSPSFVPLGSKASSAIPVDTVAPEGEL